ncbi:hypothetical protein HDU87_000327 [Geranomyces variabilis]|uniref:CoA-transferase family III n=1 Tax=Geranomyces variabilis TaxID=109894 RepID=A0AAD5TQY6_9FUNG|nr:hypothetical protein HDU87_000327 [Geranomyces variabilis]
MILADYGADVIKIETPHTGDDTRAWGPPFASTPAPHPAPSAYFLAANRNKRSVTVNLKHEAGRRIVRRLAESADVLIENFVPGKLDKWGLGYEQLKETNERLVYASITGYGPTGPYATRPGYDVIIEAEAGLMHITGEADRPPVKVGVAITDLTTGLYTHGAVMAALLSRSRTGRGQKIDISLLECQVASLVNIASSYLIAGKEATRWGTQHPSIVPYQSFRTRDAYIVVGAGNDGQFRKLAERLGDRCPALNEPRFATNEGRVKHRDEVLSALEAMFEQKTTKEWLDVLDGLEIPFAPVNNLQQTFEHPQVKHREMVQEVEHPHAGKIKLVAIPVKFSETQPTITRAPPTLGQHTREVLLETGYSDEDIDAFVKDGVV